MHLLLNIIAVIMLQPSAAALQSQTGSASGVVRNAAGAPAVGVRVAAVALPGPDTGAGEGALISLAQTDSAGRFRLENILPGRYYIQAGLIDAPTYYPGVTTTAGATSLLITAGNSINDLNFTMSRGSIGVRVSGHVPTTGTRPILIGLLGGNATTTTSAVRPDGTFEFLKVTPGRYTLQPTPSNGLPPLPIVVTDQDIEVGAPTGPGFTVSGSVGLGPHSPRPAGQKVVLVGANAWAQLESNLTADGDFSVANVAPGTYSLKTVPGSFAPIATVVVADRNVADVNVAGYAEVQGKAEIQDGRPLPASPTALMIEATPEKGLPLATAIRADGTFRFPLPEGRYHIALASLPAGTSVKSLSYGAVDLLKDPLNLDGSADIREFRVLLEVKSR